MQGGKNAFLDSYMGTQDAMPMASDDGAELATEFLEIIQDMTSADSFLG